MGSEFVARKSSVWTKKSDTKPSLFASRPFSVQTRQDNTVNKKELPSEIPPANYITDKMGLNAPQPTVQRQEDNSDKEQEPDLMSKSDESPVADEEEKISPQLEDENQEEKVNLKPAVEEGDEETVSPQLEDENKKEDLQLAADEPEKEDMVSPQLENENKQEDLNKKSIQTKLTVGEPGDKYEQEADTVAAKVVEQINSPKSQQPVQGKVEPVVQPTLMRQGGAGKGTVNRDVEQNIQQARGGGQGLADNVREPMEQAFGTDFSGVKVHTDGQSDVLNKSLNARAFTTGQDIFFKQGEYQPGNKQGQELLAHELTHVVQQGGSADIKTLNRETYIQRKSVCPGTVRETPEDSLKRFFDSHKSDTSQLPIQNLSANVENKLAYVVRDICKCANETYQKQYRKALINFLGKKKARFIWEEGNKPFLGYKASGVDYEDRFFNQGNQLGFKKTTDFLKSNPLIMELMKKLGFDDIKSIDTHYREWDVNNNDRVDSSESSDLSKFQSDKKVEAAASANSAEAQFSAADILFFSGHQFAQYQVPGVFSDDAISKYFDLRYIKKSFKQVKLIVSTSCATICQDPIKVFGSRFPNALILGYRRSAPGNGAILSNIFTKKLKNLKRPLFLEDPKDLEVIKDIWKNCVQSQHPGKNGFKRQPGWIQNNQGEYWNGKKWHKISNATSSSNKCKNKGDETTEFPSP